ncbi:MAG: sterol desaturase family protein [Opitutales bacterium]
MDSLDSFLRFVSAVYATQLGRYLIFSGSAFLICYVLFRGPLQRFKIQKSVPEWTQYRHEIFWSLVSLLIFTLVAWSIFNPWIRPHTQIYFNIGDYGWGWVGASVVLLILLHDTWFYWTHRLMHHRRLFKLFHACHHRSHSPSPWATFAFSPLEAVVQAGIIVVFAFAFPMHPLALLIWVVWMTSFNVLGHLGYEIVPSRLYRGPGRYIFNTITSHDMHHRSVRGIPIKRPPTLTQKA